MINSVPTGGAFWDSTSGSSSDEIVLAFGGLGSSQGPPFQSKKVSAPMAPMETISNRLSNEERVRILFPLQEGKRPETPLIYSHSPGWSIILMVIFAL
jgi:hypothetical protein